MKKNLVPTLVVSILFLLIAIFSLGYWIRQSQIVERRYHIFCELLPLGENKETVMETVKRFGDFEYSESLQGDNTVFVAGNYKDRSVAGNNTLIIIFQHEKYDGVFMLRNLDEREFFCGP